MIRLNSCSLKSRNYWCVKKFEPKFGIRSRSRGRGAQPGTDRVFVGKQSLVFMIRVVRRGPGESRIPRLKSISIVGKLTFASHLTWYKAHQETYYLQTFARECEVLAAHLEYEGWGGGGGDGEGRGPGAGGQVHPGDGGHHDVSGDQVRRARAARIRSEPAIKQKLNLYFTDQYLCMRVSQGGSS